jgi:hypothetical protein
MSHLIFEITVGLISNMPLSSHHELSFCVVFHLLIVKAPLSEFHMIEKPILKPTYLAANITGAMLEKMYLADISFRHNIHWFCVVA